MVKMGEIVPKLVADLRERLQEKTTIDHEFVHLFSVVFTIVSECRSRVKSFVSFE